MLSPPCSARRRQSWTRCSVMGVNLGVRLTDEVRLVGSSGWSSELETVVPARGFEPRTLGLKGRCSATELHRHGIRPPDYRCRSCRPPRSHILQDSLVTSALSLAFLGYQPEPGGRHE